MRVPARYSMPSRRGCLIMMVRQNLTSQNARESTIDIFRRVVVLSKMPIFPWLGQPPRPQSFSAKDTRAMRKNNGPAQQAVGKHSTLRESTKASGASTHIERRPFPNWGSTENTQADSAGGEDVSGNDACVCHALQHHGHQADNGR